MPIAPVSPAPLVPLGPISCAFVLGIGVHLLFELPSGIWWGALMLTAGITYSIAFRPGKNLTPRKSS